MSRTNLTKAHKILKGMLHYTDKIKGGYSIKPYSCRFTFNHELALGRLADKIVTTPARSAYAPKGSTVTRYYFYVKG